ncbi:phosphoglycolate phosphatase/pyrophosphatase PpaX [Parelusimicrobium proximum]|uniref:HAD family hydrolase n=1 Tax=Parelusimicrobium proximum TaxID=3228953 RepID=UPI003D173157
MKTDEAIIFDLDGTLTNTLPLSIKSSKEALKETAGLDLTDDEITKLFGKTEDALFKHYAPGNWQKAVDYYAECFRQNASPSIVFDGMFDVLNYLKDRNIKMALVTGRGPKSANIILEKTGLGKYFEYVRTGSELESIKTECIEEIIGLWNQRADKTYYIGDIAGDAEDAKEAGVNALSAAWFVKADLAALEAAAPFKIFNTVTEFGEWVKKDEDII